VTASIGIALTRPVDGEDTTDALWKLVDRADAAMYDAKQQGRDRVVGGVVPRPRPPLVVEPAPLEPPAPPAGEAPRPESPASDVA
jgi:hypothetical protein